MLIHLNDLPGVPAAVGNYSQAVRVGELVFLSGMLGIDPATGALESGLAAQTDRVLQNIGAALTGVGSSFNEVVMSTVFLADISYGKTVNEKYGECFTAGQMPARQTVAVKGLPLGAEVEISIIAAVK